MKTKPLIVLSLTLVIHAYAGSATWNLDPTSDWNTAANWTPNTVPDGPADTATFSISDTTELTLSAVVEVNGIAFTSDASGYIFSCSAGTGLTISGSGITNDSGMIQQFILDGDGNPPATISFINSSSAGSETSFTAIGATGGGAGQGGVIEFRDSSSADHGTFTTFATELVGPGGGSVMFFDNSTAADGTYTCNGSILNHTSGSVIFFFDVATAGDGLFTFNGSDLLDGGGGQVNFFGTSNAGSGVFTFNGGRGQGGAAYFEGKSNASQATLIAMGGIGHGGTINFLDTSKGSRARIETFGNGTLDLSWHDAPGVTIGSLEGDGIVQLGANNLTIGRSNLSTTFAGVINDGGAGGGLVKTGAGSLTLRGRNTYSGGTTVSSGNLFVDTSQGSGTGDGPVIVSRGTLGGIGTIGGQVIVGITRASGGAQLSPGSSRQAIGELLILGSLSFNGDGNLIIQADPQSGTTDEVTANGVAISIGARVRLLARPGTLIAGTTLVLISNTSEDPISGTFSNLADGSTVIVGDNTFQADYEGGDGNDLTLTVVQ